MRSQWPKWQPRHVTSLLLSRVTTQADRALLPSNRKMTGVSGCFFVGHEPRVPARGVPDSPSSYASVAGGVRLRLKYHTNQHCPDFPPEMCDPRRPLLEPDPGCFHAGLHSVDRRPQSRWRHEELHAKIEAPEARLNQESCTKEARHSLLRVYSGLAARAARLHPRAVHRRKYLLHFQSTLSLVHAVAAGRCLMRVWFAKRAMETDCDEVDSSTLR